VASVVPAFAGGLVWTDRISGGQNVRAGNFDGSNVRNLTSAGTSDPRGIIADVAGGRIYFITRATGVLQSIDFAGASAAPHVTGIVGGADLRLDVGSRVLYWCEESGGAIRKAQLPAPNIIPGSLTPQSVFSGLSVPYFLEVSPSLGKVFWGQSSSSIFSGPLAGGSPDPALYSSGSDLRGVAVDPTAGMLYWAERGNRVVRRRSIAGGTVQDIYPGLDTPHGIVLDLPAAKIYWVDTGTNGVGGFNARGVSRGDLDGSTPAEVIVAGTSSNQPWDIDIDPRVSSYAEWRSRFFRHDATASVTDKTADPDGDGLSNLLEYALGTPPLRGNSGVPIESVAVTDNSTEYAAIRFRRRSGASDLTYRVQVSGNLIEWRDENSPGGPHTVQVSTAPAEENLEWVTVRSTTTPAEQFLRVLVESPSASSIKVGPRPKKTHRRKR
jgi:DNA-binding beta-propeller fold protein YncE